MSINTNSARSREFLAELYKTIRTIRVFETRCVKLYRKGLIRGYFHPYVGEEAVATGVCAALSESDKIASTHRGHGHCVARGADLRKMMAELLGRETGYCRGRGGSMHIADITRGNLGANGIVGGGIPIGVGSALASKLQGKAEITVVFFSDGASNNGVFAESMNLAAIWNLPVIFALENNHFAVSTPIEESSRIPDLHKRAEGYGVMNDSVDGNDVLEVFDKTQKARALCLDGKGPVLLEFKTYRHGGHHVNDPGQYMPKDKLDYYMGRDPLLISRNYLGELGGVSEEEIAAIDTEVDRLMDDAILFAEQSPEPSVEAFLDEVANN